METKEYGAFEQCSIFDANDCGSVRLQEHGGLFEVRSEVVKHRKHSEQSYSFKTHDEAIAKYVDLREEMYAMFPQAMNR